MKYLYFSAGWCSPCKVLSPIMAEVGQTVSVQKIDVDKQPDMASKYNVRSIPTVVLLDGDIQVNRFVGVQTKETLLNAVK